MKATIYIICDAHGVNKMTKQPPALGKGEIAIKVNVSVPVSVFEEYRPIVDLTVSERQVTHAPIQVEAEGEN